MSAIDRVLEKMLQLQPQPQHQPKIYTYGDQLPNGETFQESTWREYLIDKLSLNNVDRMLTFTTAQLQASVNLYFSSYLANMNQRVSDFTSALQDTYAMLQEEVRLDAHAMLQEKVRQGQKPLVTRPVGPSVAMAVPEAPADEVIHIADDELYSSLGFGFAAHISDDEKFTSLEPLRDQAPTPRPMTAPIGFAPTEEIVGFEPAYAPPPMVMPQYAPPPAVAAWQPPLPMVSAPSQPQAAKLYNHLNYAQGVYSALLSDLMARSWTLFQPTYTYPHANVIAKMGNTLTVWAQAYNQLVPADDIHNSFNTVTMALDRRLRTATGLTGDGDIDKWNGMVTIIAFAEASSKRNGAGVYPRTMGQMVNVAKSMLVSGQLQPVMDPEGGQIRTLGVLRDVATAMLRQSDNYRTFALVLHAFRTMLHQQNAIAFDDYDLTFEKNGRESEANVLDDHACMFAVRWWLTQAVLRYPITTLSLFTTTQDWMALLEIVKKTKEDLGMLLSYVTTDQYARMEGTSWMAAGPPLLFQDFPAEPRGASWSNAEYQLYHGMRQSGHLMLLVGGTLQPMRQIGPYQHTQSMVIPAPYFQDIYKTADFQDPKERAQLNDGLLPTLFDNEQIHAQRSLVLDRVYREGLCTEAYDLCTTTPEILSYHLRKLQRFCDESNREEDRVRRAEGLPVSPDHHVVPHGTIAVSVQKLRQSANPTFKENPMYPTRHPAGYPLLGQQQQPQGLPQHAPQHMHAQQQYQPPQLHQLHPALQQQFQQPMRNPGYPQQQFLPVQQFQQPQQPMPPHQHQSIPGQPVAQLPNGMWVDAWGNPANQPIQQPVRPGFPMGMNGMQMPMGGAVATHSVQPSGLGMPGQHRMGGMPSTAAAGSPMFPVSQPIEQNVRPTLSLPTQNAMGVIEHRQPQKALKWWSPPMAQPAPQRTMHGAPATVQPDEELDYVHPDKQFNSNGTLVDPRGGPSSTQAQFTYYASPYDTVAQGASYDQPASMENLVVAWSNGMGVYDSSGNRLAVYLGLDKTGRKAYKFSTFDRFVRQLVAQAEAAASMNQPPAQPAPRQPMPEPVIQIPARQQPQESKAVQVETLSPKKKPVPVQVRSKKLINPKNVARKAYDVVTTDVKLELAEGGGDQCDWVVEKLTPTEGGKTKSARLAAATPHEVQLVVNAMNNDVDLYDGLSDTTYLNGVEVDLDGELNKDAPPLENGFSEDSNYSVSSQARQAMTVSEAVKHNTTRMELDSDSYLLGLYHITTPLVIRDTAARDGFLEMVNHLTKMAEGGKIDTLLQRVGAYLNDAIVANFKEKAGCKDKDAINWIDTRLTQAVSNFITDTLGLDVILSLTDGLSQEGGEVVQFIKDNFSAQHAQALVDAAPTIVIEALRMVESSLMRATLNVVHYDEDASQQLVDRLIDEVGVELTKDEVLPTREEVIAEVDKRFNSNSRIVWFVEYASVLSVDFNYADLRMNLDRYEAKALDFEYGTHLFDTLLTQLEALQINADETVNHRRAYVTTKDGVTISVAKSRFQEGHVMLKIVN